MSPVDPATIHKNVLTIMDNSGLSLREMSVFLNCSPSQVERMKSGERPITIFEGCLLSALSGVTLDDIANKELKLGDVNRVMSIKELLTEFRENTLDRFGLVRLPGYNLNKSRASRV